MMPIDSNGLPGTLGENHRFDGGDTAAILGTIVALEPAEGYARSWATKTIMLISAAGYPRRHPDLSKWYGMNDRFSRDQLLPLICAAIRFKDHPDLNLFFQAHAQRWFLFAWNSRKNGAVDAPKKMPDFTGPEIWALWIRYREPWWGFAVLWIFDGELLVGAFLWRWREDRVCRNHMLSAIFSRRYRPTITSRIAFALTDFKGLIERWRAHCEAVREYQTADLFEGYWWTHAD